MCWPTDAQAQYWSSIVTIFGLPVASIALLAALRQLWLSQRTGSVTALVSIHDSLRECWSDYLKANIHERDIPFGDLCNTIEAACAASFDRVFFGKSGEVLTQYLLSALKLIEQDEQLRNKLLALLEDPSTFIYMRRFLTKNRRTFKRMKLDLSS